MSKELKRWIKEDLEDTGVINMSTDKLIREYFFRDEARPTMTDRDYFYSPADGIILYAKELQNGTDKIIEVKGVNYSLEEEIGKGFEIRYPCKILSVFMSAFDVHINRMPTDGILSRYELDTIASHNKPMLFTENKLLEGKIRCHGTMDWLFTNERVVNKVYYPELNYTYYMVQVADYDVGMIVPFVQKQVTTMTQSQRFGMIRWGSMTSLILPKHSEFDFEFVEEEQYHVKAGFDPLVKIIRDKKDNKEKKEEKSKDDDVFYLNTGTDRIAIPKKYKIEIQGMIDDGCDDCIDEFLKSIKQ